jgi:hypothetical protein
MSRVGARGVRVRARALGVELIAVRSAGHSDCSSVFKNDRAEPGEIRWKHLWPSQSPQFPLATRQAIQEGASKDSTLHRARPLAGYGPQLSR